MVHAGYARSAGLGRFGDTTQGGTQVLVGCLLIGACLLSGALVLKRHTCADFIVSELYWRCIGQCEEVHFGRWLVQTSPKIQRLTRLYFEELIVSLFLKIDFATGGGSGSDLDV